MSERINIKSSGDPFTTSVKTSDGQLLPCVKSVIVTLEPNRFSKAEIEMEMLDVDVVADGELFVTTLPSGKRFRLTPL